MRRPTVCGCYVNIQRTTCGSSTRLRRIQREPLLSGRGFRQEQKEGEQDKEEGRQEQTHTQQTTQPIARTQQVDQTPHEKQMQTLEGGSTIHGEACRQMLLQQKVQRMATQQNMQGIGSHVQTTTRILFGHGRVCEQQIGGKQQRQRQQRQRQHGNQ